MGMLRHEGLPIGVAFVWTAADVYVGSMLGFGMQFGGSSDLLKRFFRFSFPPFVGDGSDLRFIQLPRDARERISRIDQDSSYQRTRPFSRFALSCPGVAAGIIFGAGLQD